MDRLLVDFNMLMNYDYAAIMVAKDVYQNKDNMRTLFYEMEMNQQYSILEDREERNPLHIILKDSEDADNILIRIFEDYTDNIISNIIFNTNIHTVVKACDKNSMVSVTICCKNQMEQQVINNIFGYDTVLESDVNYDKYDSFMIHYKDTLIDNYNNYRGKCVYLAMTRYNLLYLEEQDKLILPPDVLSVVIDKINLKLIGLFNNYNK